MTEIIIEINPFTERIAVLPKKKKMVAVDENRKILDIKTGEQTSILHNFSITHEEINFIKIYRDNAIELLKLSEIGMKMFFFCCYKLRNNNDVVYLSSKEFIEWSGYKSRKSCYDGLKNLLENNLIVGTTQRDFYFINYGIFFNGNRLNIKSEFRK